MDFLLFFFYMTPWRLSVVFMWLLVLWAIGNLFVALVALRQHAELTVFWKTTFAWNIVNLALAGFSLLTLYEEPSNSLTQEKAERSRSIVGFNIILDAVYVIIALVLLRHKNKSYKQVGRALRVQGLFLLIFDSLLYILFWFVL